MSTLDDLLGDLQSELVKSLLARVRAGEATAADLNVARQLLKDHNVTSLPERDKNLQDLHKQLPFTKTDEFGLPN